VLRGLVWRGFHGLDYDGYAYTVVKCFAGDEVSVSQLLEGLSKVIEVADADAEFFRFGSVSGADVNEEFFNVGYFGGFFRCLFVFGRFNVFFFDFFIKILDDL
jgi:hypothetical protein